MSAFHGSVSFGEKVIFGALYVVSSVALDYQSVATIINPSIAADVNPAVATIAEFALAQLAALAGRSQLSEAYRQARGLLRGRKMAGMEYE